MTRTLHGFDAPYLAALLTDLAAIVELKTMAVADVELRTVAHKGRLVAARLRESAPVQMNPLYQGDGPCTCAFCQDARSRPHDL